MVTLGNNYVKCSLLLVDSMVFKQAKLPLPTVGCTLFLFIYFAVSLQYNLFMVVVSVELPKSDGLLP